MGECSKGEDRLEIFINALEMFDREIFNSNEVRITHLIYKFHFFQLTISGSGRLSSKIDCDICLSPVLQNVSLSQ